MRHLNRLMQLSLSLSLAFFVSACGEDKSGTTQDIPQSGSGTTNNTPTSGTSKWTATELQTQSQYCSEAGDTTYYDQAAWLKFCTCTYQAAAKHWAYQEFFDDFETNYNTLYNEGSIPNCLRQAGMTMYLAK